jgi:hypothetical protein
VGVLKVLSPTDFPMSWDGIDSVQWKEGSVHEPNCKSFLLTEAERSMSGDARDFNNIETRAVIKFLFLT